MSSAIAASAALSTPTTGTDASLPSPPRVVASVSRTLTDVRDQITEDDAGKWDSIARCREITLHQGRLAFPEASEQAYDSGFALTPWATAQICQRLGIPAAYFKK